MGKGRKPYTIEQRKEQSLRMKAKWACPEYRKSQKMSHKNGNTGGHNKQSIIVNCLTCGIERETTKSRYKNGYDKYCDKECSNKTGEKSGPDKLERSRFRKEMQKAVFERDDYTCQMCGDRGCALQVDHIQSWADYVELRFSMDNLRTLCMDCHYLITFGREKPSGVTAWGHNLKHLGG